MAFASFTPETYRIMPDYEMRALPSPSLPFSEGRIVRLLRGDLDVTFILQAHARYMMYTELRCCEAPLQTLTRKLMVLTLWN
jgi:hypothetical protein